MLAEEMTEEQIARCFEIEDFRDHPELHVHQGDRTFVCDKRHADVWYSQGWNDSLKNHNNSNRFGNHPAALRAYEMGYLDSDAAVGELPIPSLNVGVEAHGALGFPAKGIPGGAGPG